MASSEKSVVGMNGAELRHYGLWIGGYEVPSEGDSRIPVIDPSTGEPWSSIADATDADVAKAVASALATGESGWRTSAALRSKSLFRLAELIEEHADELAACDVRDNGKILRETANQIRGVPRWYRYFAGLADKVQGYTVPSDRPSAVNFTVREPLGVIACITAWNSPLLLVAVKLAPALAAGNAAVLKPSEFASSSTLEFARLCIEAGMPQGVVNVVTGGPVAGEALIRHPGIAHVNFTGSPRVGAIVAAAAGSALKGVTLELGGKSPNIIFEDAPMDAAIAGVLGGMFAAAGQSCVAGSRVLVQRSVYEEVVTRLRARADAILLGDPRNAQTEMGPIANRPQLEKIEYYVGAALEDGAKLVTGGAKPQDPALASGLYYLPTIFADVPAECRLAREEVFGPVMAIIPFTDEDEALKIANSTDYGLASGVWTSDLSRAHRMAQKLQSGSVFINTYRAMEPGMPVSGFKQSGIGHENGMDAVLEFTQTKAIWVETEPAAADPFKMRI